ncbi:hypothetical protein N657DRAFT_630648 [Parathielavia appendiculata]|uniref:BZIP domain-containing protein n=1 Tax=Parathielavia appendiculata TaxID=2587402 RepID=A0AAN6U7W1_9PEZI|nr:hypothetical protein N657DRAFT_630648 [Parathielavia appendiculata]
MSPQPAHVESHKLSKGKGKGARRVSNLSEEQRNKKRENDRIAQQNIRRRNKELIEKLQHEVECLRNLERVDMVNQLVRRNHELEDRVRFLEKALSQRTGRSFPPSCYDANELPRCRHAGDYNVPQSFGSPYLAGAANPYDHWPSSVVPVPSAVVVKSVESSPGASGPGEDYTHTPAYVHTSVPLAEGPAAMASTSSAPSLGSVKAEYRDADAGSSSNNSYPSHSVQQSSPAYLQESPWPVYPASNYYSQATAI